MTLPNQFKEENIENIRIYHFVEEFVASYKKLMEKIMADLDIPLSEVPFLIRLRFVENSTQQDLVDLFRVSKGYTAKLMRKFEDNGLITRYEDPRNRRKKIVNLTKKGIEKTDELIEFMDVWESSVTKSLNDEEVATLKQLLFKVTLDCDKL